MEKQQNPEDLSHFSCVKLLHRKNDSLKNEIGRNSTTKEQKSTISNFAISPDKSQRKRVALRLEKEMENYRRTIQARGSGRFAGSPGGRCISVEDGGEGEEEEKKRAKEKRSEAKRNEKRVDVGILGSRLSAASERARREPEVYYREPHRFRKLCSLYEPERLTANRFEICAGFSSDPILAPVSTQPFPATLYSTSAENRDKNHQETPSIVTARTGRPASPLSRSPPIAPPFFHRLSKIYIIR